MSKQQFNLAAMLGDVSKLNTDRQIEKIHISKLHGDENNFYSVTDVSNLADSIALIGLQAPINVRPDPEHSGEYIVVSGHRRREAVTQLVEDGREDLAMVDCIVDRTQRSAAWQELCLIYGNSATRDLTSAELSHQAERVRELFYQLQQEGVEFPGRMRSHVAEACNITESKLARLDAIRNNLKPALMARFESGEINESVAYELSRLSGCEQDIIESSRGAKENGIKWLSASTVQHISKEIGKATVMCNSLRCKPTGGQCEHGRDRMAAAKLDSWQSLNCSGCCLECHSLESCSHPCKHAEGKRKELRQITRNANAEAKAREAEREKPGLVLLQRAWERTVAAMDAAKVEPKDFCAVSRGWSSSVDAEDVKAIREGRRKWSAFQVFPCFVPIDTAKKLIATADLLGVSIDYLLGREGAKAAPDGWHTGNPTEPGEYPVQVDWSGRPIMDIYYWTGADWRFTQNDSTSLPLAAKVLQWCDRPPAAEEGQND